ncbi:50S ribosomal protein L30e-like protein [Polychytrium aggregatum]|uniref:50S ribosomal protein L30e-like protein n=1 Tax=Polychytrium aggregatum TaxID=110093 RepID=UPI0022FDE05A|nr:50S ribosomal protein L30e-like protein [Polychytrium aggregatum]KAI9207809.1 50S ribosomal protein L30e-like protein [Polychytrium aggregatum]
MAKDKTPTKAKAEKAAKTADADDDKEAVSYETRVLSVSPIAHPLATKKLTKKLLKTVKKAAKSKNVKRGVKEVVKGLRKGSKGVVVIAGDISPIDVITHVPVLCEEADIPYIYVPSKEDLGLAGSTKRPTSVIMVVKKDAAEYKELYDEILGDVKELNQKLITTV